MKTYKGFNKDMTCRGFQYEVGKEYEIDGDRSVASNSGDRSVASNSGYRSVAEVTNNESVACALGIESKAKGKVGCWLVICEWQYINDSYHRIDTQCVKVDGLKVKEDTYYTLKNGKLVECED